MCPGVPQANGSIAVEPTMDGGHKARAVAPAPILLLDADVQIIRHVSTQRVVVSGLPRFAKEAVVIARELTESDRAAARFRARRG